MTTTAHSRSVETEEPRHLLRALGRIEMQGYRATVRSVMVTATGSQRATDPLIFDLQCELTLKVDFLDFWPDFTSRVSSRAHCSTDIHLKC
jgi:hypothetical protein